MNSSTSDRGAKLLFSLGLAAITLALFWDVASFDFISLDDNSYVYDNRFVQQGVTGDALRAILTRTFNGHWHPLTMFSYMVDTQLYGPGPGGYHLTNLLLHISNTVLLFLLLQYLTGGLWRSALVAVLFAIHPLHVEPVVWIASRKDLLSTAFFFMVIGAYASYVRAPSLGRYIVVLVCLLAGLMSKATVSTVIGVFFILDYWPLNRYEDDGSESPRSIVKRMAKLCIEKLPFIVLVGAFAILAVSFAVDAGAMAPLTDLTPSMRLASAINTYGMLLLKTVWPVHLAPLYPHEGAHLPTSRVIVFAALLLIITLVTVFRARRSPYLIVGWFWYLGIVAPLSGVLQAGFQAYADRYAYVSLIGIFIMLAWGMAEIFGDKPRARLAASLPAAALVALWILSFNQISHWRNDLSLFEHTVEVTSKNYLADKLLGDTYYKLGKTQEAVAAYRRSFEVQPNDPNTYVAMGIALNTQGKTEGAISHYETALTLDSNHTIAHGNLASILYERGDLDGAAEHYEAALRVDPEFTSAWNGLGLIAFDAGRYEEARERFEEGLRIGPSNVALHLSLGVLLAREGDPAEALAAFDRAVGLDPGNPRAHNNRGIVLAQSARYDEAVAAFRKALELDPSHENARRNLAQCLSDQAESE